MSAVTYTLSQLRGWTIEGVQANGPAQAAMLALAAIADEALDSPLGYDWTSALDVARVTGASERATYRTLVTLASRGDCRMTGLRSKTFRVNEAAFEATS